LVSFDVDFFRDVPFSSGGGGGGSGTVAAPAEAAAMIAAISFREGWRTVRVNLVCSFGVVNSDLGVEESADRPRGLISIDVGRSV